MLLIPLVLVKSIYWQDMFNSYPQSFAPACCAEVAEAKSVK
jgi:hypothetical protein